MNKVMLKDSFTAPSEAALRRMYGSMSSLVVILKTGHAPNFVHCHECRWPVSPGRHSMQVATSGPDGGQVRATEEQMQRICSGVRVMAETPDNIGWTPNPERM